MMFSPSTVSTRSASVAEVDEGVVAELGERVPAVDLADRAALRPHHERLRGGAARAVVDAAQQVAVGDTGGAEEHVVALDQVVRGEDLVEVETGVDRALPLLVGLRPQLGLDLAAEALQRAGG